jgi:hypothetical protein
MHFFIAIRIRVKDFNVDQKDFHKIFATKICLFQEGLSQPPLGQKGFQAIVLFQCSM